MHQQFANGFYGSNAWKKCREAYRRSKGGLCERCMARGLIVPGDEVHHRQPLTPDNLGDPGVTLSWANLELLCKACHQDEHEREARITRTDRDGHVEL